MTRRRNWLTAAVILLVVVMAAGDVAEAQRRGGGGRGFGRGDRDGRFGGRGFRRGDRGGRFGGRGFGRGGLLGRLFRDSVQQELDLTEDQQERLRELAESGRSNRSGFREVFQRLREADSDEEREAIREEMQRQREERERETEEKLKQVLDAEQFTRLQQLALHDRGPRAFRDDEVAARLKLTDSQQKEIETILDSQDDRRGALVDQIRSGELDRDAMREKFEEMRRKLEAKLLAVLNDEQKSSWEQMLGPPPPDSERDGDGPDGRFRGFGRGRGGGRRGGGDRGRPPFSGDAESDREGSENAPARSSTTVLPNGEEVPGDRAASFSTGDANETAAETDGPSATGSDAASEAPEGSAQERYDSDEDAKRLSFNFRDAPWEDVLKLFARTAGLTLDLNDVPPGTFSYYDTRSYTPSEALDILNGYLLPKGYILVRRNRFLVVLNLENGVPPNLVPDVSVNELSARGDNELMRVVFPLDENAEPEEIAGEVERLLGPQGKAVPLSASHSVAVTDIGSNLRRVHELIEGGAGTQDPGDLVFKALPLTHIPATDAERYVRALFGLGSGVENVSAAADRDDDRRSRWRRMMRRRFGRDDDDDDDDDRSRSNSSGANGNSQVNVTADLRTNSLLAKAPAREMKLIEQVVEAIDVEQSGVDTQVAAMSNAPELRVYEVEDADAREVAKTLDAMMSGVVVNEDGRNDLLHIRATPAEHQQIEQWIRLLDGGGTTQVAILPVGGIDPSMASSMLNSLFLSDGSDAPTIQPNLMGRGLIVRGTPAQVAQVRTVLAQQGLTGNGGLSGGSGGGKVRRFSFGGRDPREFARLIERLWSSTSDNPLRVVVPEPPNPIREERTPNDREPESPRPSTNETHFTPGTNGTDADRNRRPRRDREPGGDKPQNEKRPSDAPKNGGLNVRDSGGDGNPVLPAALLAQADSRPAPQRRPEPESPQAGDSSGDKQSSGESGEEEGPPVTVSVTDGQVIIASDDEEALNRLERIIQSLTQAIPNQTRWTVFYLRSADCTDAAAMLEQIIPGSSVTAPTDGLGGLPPLGTGTATPATAVQTLRIIPEERSNALFVSGTPSQIRQVEDVLKILDASELPQQLRDRMPRYIELEHADATRVAGIIRDVYQDYLGASSNGRGDRDDDRRRGRGGNSNQQPAQLTVGVDTRTNAVVVSADEALYQEIRGLVDTLEDAAQQANRTVRVVTLQNTDSTVVQEALTSLLPKVNVSISGSETQTSRTQSGESQDSRRGRRAADDDDDDRRNRIREFFRRRMEERRRRGGDRGGRGDRGGFRGRGPRGGGFPFGRRRRGND